MCAMLNGVPAGNPVKLTEKVTVPAVMLLAASRVTSKVIVAVPLPAASAPAIAGTSFAGLRAAVNVGLIALGLVGVLSEHPHDATAITNAHAAKRLIVVLLLRISRTFATD